MLVRLTTLLNIVGQKCRTNLVRHQNEKELLICENIDRKTLKFSTNFLAVYIPLRGAVFHGAPASAVPEIITSGEGALGGTSELSARSQSRAPTRPARRATRRDPARRATRSDATRSPRGLTPS